MLEPMHLSESEIVWCNNDGGRRSTLSLLILLGCEITINVQDSSDIHRIMKETERDPFKHFGAGYRTEVER